MTAPSQPLPTASTLHGANGDAAALAAQLVDHLQRVIIGKPAVVELVVATLLADGHLLIQDVPGLGKTLLARAVARTVGGQESRIQGVPDLLPGDVTGSSVWRPDRGEFQFVPGPLFANVVMVDEANRMPPRTQAALLEAMEEGQVSVDGVTHALPQPHLVIATQNPLEQHGTHPLPESQLDRFTAATSIGYPDPVSESAIITAQLRSAPLSSLTPLMDLHQLAGLQAAVRDVTASPALVDYAVRLVRSTRDAPGVVLGASPRAGLQLVRVAQASALLQQRPAALPDDVKRHAVAVLAHRLVMDGRTRSAADAIDEALSLTSVSP